jgi:hypothetical protein
MMYPTKYKTSILNTSYSDLHKDDKCGSEYAYFQICKFIRSCHLCVAHITKNFTVQFCMVSIDYVLLRSSTSFWTGPGQRWLCSTGELEACSPLRLMLRSQTRRRNTYKIKVVQRDIKQNHNDSIFRANARILAYIGISQPLITSHRDNYNIDNLQLVLT